MTGLDKLATGNIVDTTLIEPARLRYPTREKSCQACGRTFFVSLKSSLKRVRFCTMQCSFRVRSKPRKPIVECTECKRTLDRSEVRLMKDGRIQRRVCHNCPLPRSGPRRFVNKIKAQQCEMCGFNGLPCQLDVHHIDENHKNNALHNLQTLCANCHRLITLNSRLAARARRKSGR